MSGDSLLAMQKSALDVAVDSLDRIDKEDYEICLRYTRSIAKDNIDYVCRQLAIHSVQLAKYQGLSIPKLEGNC